MYLSFDGCTAVGLVVLPFLSGTVQPDGTAHTPSIPFPSGPPGITIFSAALTVDTVAGKVYSVTDPIVFTTQ